jgi:hypothetical protein
VAAQGAAIRGLASPKEEALNVGGDIAMFVAPRAWIALMGWLTPEFAKLRASSRSAVTVA